MVEEEEMDSQDGRESDEEIDRYYQYHHSSVLPKYLFGMDYGPVLQSYFSVSWKSFSLEGVQNVLLNVQEHW